MSDPPPAGKLGSVTVASALDAPPARVWERIATPEGINDEMRPLLQMTLPRGVESLDPRAIEVGVPLGRSWILLFGLVPFDYDDITLTRLEAGKGFLEESRMLSQRYWRHERTLEPLGEGTLITDRLAWQPRLPLPAKSLAPVVRGFFGHRHKRLRRHFGGTAAQ